MIRCFFIYKLLIRVWIKNLVVYIWFSLKARIIVSLEISSINSRNSRKVKQMHQFYYVTSLFCILKCLRKTYSNNNRILRVKLCYERGAISFLTFIERSNPTKNLKYIFFLNLDFFETWIQHSEGVIIASELVLNKMFIVDEFY